MAHYYICLHPVAKWLQNLSNSMTTQIMSHKAQNRKYSHQLDAGTSHSFNGHNYNLTINTQGSNISFQKRFPGQ